MRDTEQLDAIFKEIRWCQDYLYRNSSPTEKSHVHREAAAIRSYLRIGFKFLMKGSYLSALASFERALSKLNDLSLYDRRHGQDGPPRSEETPMGCVPRIRKS